MKIETSVLLSDLEKLTQQNLIVAEDMLKTDISFLNKKTPAESWSALECVEHLNRYGDFYLPEIATRLDAATKTAQKSIFKSGFLGNKFAEMMRPGAKGMNTFKSMNPANSSRTIADIEKFIAQQYKMLELLKRCADYNLSSIKTSISISNLIKLKLGDTLRVVIYHNERHLLQAQKSIERAKAH